MYLLLYLLFHEILLFLEIKLLYIEILCVHPVFPINIENKKGNHK